MKKLLILLLLPMSANASFTCAGRNLVTDLGEIYRFSSDRDCNAALAAANNGFTCDGRQLVTSKATTVSFPNERECLAAVNAAK